MKQINKAQTKSSGVTLLEVVLAMAVFAFGFLALMEMQGSIARSSADANTRTVAANIAEEIVETAKGFTQVPAADNGRMDYNEIVTYDSAQTVGRGGIDYTVDLEVTDYFYIPTVGTGTFKEAGEITEGDKALLPGGAIPVFSDMKVLALEITWNPVNQQGAVDSGILQIKEIIPSTPSLIGALIAAEDDDAGSPTVDYTPGENPDIVAIKLGNNGKFKESTSPQPDVIRDTNETWFDIVTYSQGLEDGKKAIFLRREEFVAVTCDCELLQSVSDSGDGLQPTLWNGYSYNEGEIVAKDYGQRVNGSPESLYCDICCRDHHEGASNLEEHIYNTGAGGGDHPHFARDNQGVIDSTPVAYGEDYVEACRLIRKDGFMRVTKDALQQELFGFPEEYLTFDDNVLEYSEYIIAATEDYYEDGQQGFAPPEQMAPPYIITASEPGIATHLPTVYFSNNQQLRARALYTDYLTEEARLNVEHCFDNAGEPTPDDEGCHVPNVSSPLEIYPFFDLQMTWLARWERDQVFVDVSNESLSKVNPSRGLADLIDMTEQGQTKVTITSHSGNLGLTATGPIDPDSYMPSLNKQLLYIDSNLDNTPALTEGLVVSGLLTSTVRGLDASTMQISGEQALCGQTDVEYSCLVRPVDPAFPEVLPPTAKITVSGYSKKSTALWICGGDGLTESSRVLNEGLLPNKNPIGGTISTTFTVQVPQAVDDPLRNFDIEVSLDEFCN